MQNGNMSPVEIDYYTLITLAFHAQQKAIDANNDPAIGLSRPVRIKPEQVYGYFSVICGIDAEYSREQVDACHLGHAVEQVIEDSRRLDAELEDAIDAEHHDTLASLE